MTGWLARLRRVDTLAAEVAGLRARLSEVDAVTALETERARAAIATAALGDKLTELHALALAEHERAAAAASLLAALVGRVMALEGDAARSDRSAAAVAAQGEEITALRAQLLTLERQFRLQAKHADDTVQVLSGRIEQVRRGEVD